MEGVVGRMNGSHYLYSNIYLRSAHALIDICDKNMTHYYMWFVYYGSSILCRLIDYCLVYNATKLVCINFYN